MLMSAWLFHAERHHFLLFFHLQKQRGIKLVRFGRCRPALKDGRADSALLQQQSLCFCSDPVDFHAIFHDMSLEALAHDAPLLAALERLPGRRLIFTNADEMHATRVLAHLGLADLFDDVFHIGSAGYEPKPSVEAFTRIGAAHGIDPMVTAFFEDAERNLAPAADLGMTTVLVGAHAAASTATFVHHRTETLAPFLAGAQLKEAA